MPPELPNSTPPEPSPTAIETASKMSGFFRSKTGRVILYVAILFGLYWLIEPVKIVRALKERAASHSQIEMAQNITMLRERLAQAKTLEEQEKIMQEIKAAQDNFERGIKVNPDIAALLAFIAPLRQQTSAFHEDLDAFGLESKNWFVTAIKSPADMAGVRTQVAKLKTENEQLNASNVALLAEMNRMLAQKDTSSGIPLGTLTGFRDSFSKRFPNMQAQSECLNKLFTSTDQILADLQANPLKWRRETNGKLTFLDLAFQTKMVSELGEAEALEKQSDDLVRQGRELLKTQASELTSGR